MLNIVDYLSESELLTVLDKYNAFDIKAHGKKVSIYALCLLDSLHPHYEFKEEERNLLHYSAILHDIGNFINKQNHHKHTKYIILKEPLLDNLPRDLRDYLAFIASGHGKSFDVALGISPNKEKDTILKLISILRIADALDHKHNLGVTLEKIEIRNLTLNIHINGEVSNLILKRIKKKSCLFSKIYNLPICVKCT